jgi:hypothetical protein
MLGEGSIVLSKTRVGFLAHLPTPNNQTITAMFKSTQGAPFIYHINICISA